MRVMIAGAGEVGTHLARMLSNEEHDIVLMDLHENKLKQAGYGSDILTVEGTPTSIRDLKLHGIQNTDLFVSVMPEESANITACMLASRLGAKKTLARISNCEYAEGDHLKFFENLGINALINPDMLAAQEIISAIRNPWARQYIDLFDGALALLGVKVRKGAPLVGMQLSQFSAEEQKLFHLVAITRDQQTIIPCGNDIVQDGDIVFFTCGKNHLSEVRRMAGKEHMEVKKVVIMGASRIAVLATNYMPAKISVSIIEQNPERCAEIATLVPSRVQIFNGDGRSPEILREAGLDDADVFIALSENSETNVLACLGAKRYGVFKTIAREENIDYIPLAERLDIGTLINKKLIAAGHIYRMLLGADTGSVKCLTIAHADVAELVAKRDSRITKKPVKDLVLPKGITFGGVVRSGVPAMVDGNTILEPYDHVVVFCLNTSMNKLEDLFS